MSIIRIALVVIMAMQISPAFAEEKEMPIIAYWGVPEGRTTDADFHTFMECGFNVSLYPYKSLDALVRACRCADKFGVRILGSCPEMFDSPTKAARTLRQENGFFGYQMQDEPNVEEIRLRQKDIEKLRSIDSTHVFYLNLLPFQKKDPQWVFSVTKASTYQEYLRVASATSCQQISFDHYPITTRGLRETWYHNLEMIRQESIRSNKSFWGFVLSVPHVDYPQPTMGSLRLQIYSNLAYGAQAIQYFTYWTPANNKKYDFHDAPMSSGGKKTKTYALVQKMNEELKPIARLFYGAKILSVHHLGVIADGTTRQTENPENLSSLKIVGKKGVVLSIFEKEGHRYLAMVNKDYKENMTVLIKAKNSIPCRITKTLQEEKMRESYRVLAGDILLIRLK